MRDLEAVLKAVADPTRLRVLKLLEAGELCGCQIQEVLGLSASTVSKHLAVLKSAGLALDRRDGRWIYYRLAPHPRNAYAASLLTWLRGPLDREAEVRADRKVLREVRRVPVEELCAARATKGGRPG